MDEVFETKLHDETSRWLVEKDRELSLGQARPPRPATASELDALIEDIARGTHRSGTQPEYEAWLHFLLPFVVSEPYVRCGNHSSFEALVTAFMNCHWADHGRHPDAVWEDEVMAVGSSLKLAVNYDVTRADPGFCAAVVFALKYLTPTSIDDWVASVCASSNHMVRAQWLRWLHGAWRFLEADVPLECLTRTEPHVDWRTAEQLCPKGADARSFLPQANVIALRHAFQHHLGGPVVPVGLPVSATAIARGALRAAVPLPNVLSTRHLDRIAGGLLYATSSNVPWATLLARTFEFDVKACAYCGDRLEVRAVVTDHDIARQILAAIPTTARAPPAIDTTVRYEPALA